MEEKKSPPVSEVVTKLRESFALLTSQLKPEVEPATVYSPGKSKE